MTPTQRAAAERLADELQRFDGAERESLRDEAAALLRELAADPVQETMQKKPSTASQFESVKEAKKVAEAQLSYYRKMMADKSTAPVVNQQMMTEPVQEPGVEYKRGYEEALNDCIRNGGEEWARSMFANNAEHIKPVQTPVVLDLLEQSRQNCLRNFGPNGLADWIYKDLGELLADAAPQQRKPLTDDEALALIRATPQEDVTQEGWIRRQRLSWVRAIERAIIGEQK